MINASRTAQDPWVSSIYRIIQAKQRANARGAAGCYYISAKTQTGVKEAFEGCVQAWLHPGKQNEAKGKVNKQRTCCVQ